MPEPPAIGGSDGREARFRSLYAGHYQAVQAYAVRRMQNRSDVADVVADVFSTAWRRLDEVPPAPADLLWLYGVARRVLATRRRGTRRLASLIGRLEANHDSLAASQPAPGAPISRVLAAMATLRPAEREALQLVYWEQLSHAEAAVVVGCSANAVTIRVHRAKAKLRQALSAGHTAGRTVPSADQADSAHSASYQPHRG